MAAAVDAVGIRPFAESLFAVKPYQVDIVFVRHALQRSGHLQPKRRGGAAVVGAHEAHTGHLLGIVMAAQNHDASGMARKARDEVRHGHGPARYVGGETVFGHLAAAGFQLLLDERPQIAQRLRSGLHLSKP
jgi:hypothetical protein